MKTPSSKEDCCKECFNFIRSALDAGGHVYCSDNNCLCHSSKEEKCSCGEPHISDRITHRYDGKPCYVTDSIPTPQSNRDTRFDELDELFEYEDMDGNCSTNKHKVINKIKDIVASEIQLERERIGEIIEKVFEEIVNEYYGKTMTSPIRKMRVLLLNRLKDLDTPNI